jgi:hypothetical protein
MTFSRYCVAAIAGAAVWLLGAHGSLQAQDGRFEVRASSASELSAQNRRPRARTRIEVYPRRSFNPGPNAERDCVSWLEPEWRPSGTVIVPHLRCWWVPG